MSTPIEQTTPGQARELMVRGQRVIVRIRGTVETVAHDLRCEWCQKILRPKYTTDTKRDRVRRRFRSEEHASEFGSTHYDGPDAAGWYEAEGWVETIARRTFAGSFGSYGDDTFCGLNCARWWALAVWRAIDQGNAQLISTKTRRAVTYRKAE